MCVPVLLCMYACMYVHMLQYHIYTIFCVLGVGSGQPMVPSNGNYEMTEIHGPMDYDDVISNKSALQYETPQSTLKTSFDSNEYDNIQDPQSLFNDVCDRNDRLYSDVTITDSQTVPHADTSDHEYQEADEISPEEVHQLPSVRTLVCIRTHIHMYVQIHTHTHARTHTRTCTHTSTRCECTQMHGM